MHTDDNFDNTGIGFMYSPQKLLMHLAQKMGVRILKLNKECMYNGTDISGVCLCLHVVCGWAC